MEFSVSTLSSTFENFDRALARRGLSLAKHTARDVWANIVLGRNYSAAASLAKAHNKVRAIPITASTIREILREKSRAIDESTALAIFVESTKDQLNELSTSLHELSELVQSKEQTCLIQASGDYYGFGIVDSEFAGYLGLESLYNFELGEEERKWYKASSDIVTGTVNAVAGVENDVHLIHVANMRLGFKKEDDVFAEFCIAHKDALSLRLAEKLLLKFPASEMQNWDVEFRKVYDIVYSVFEDSVFNHRRSWLKIDCNLADMVIDHTSVRLLEAMNWMSQDRDVETALDPLDSLTYSAKLPMEHILRIQDR